MLSCAVHFVLVSVPQIPFPEGIALCLAARFLLLCLKVKCLSGPTAYGCVTTCQKLSDGKQCCICMIVPIVQKPFGVKLSV